MPFCQPAAVLQRVADALACDVAQLPARWASLVAEATKEAAADITSAIGLKAYSAAQIVASDGFAAWHERLSYCYTMYRGVGLANYDLAAVKALDPLPMLKLPVALLFSGKPLPPDATSDVGGISSGVRPQCKKCSTTPTRGACSADRVYERVTNGPSCLHLH